MSATRIAVAGNINADITYELPRLPLPGETLLADGLSLGPGGKAANAGVALARLQAAPLLIGCVGRDTLGELVLAALQREGVKTASISRRSEAPTGLATVFVPPRGENAIVTHLGANLAMAVAGIPSLDGCEGLLMTLGLPLAVLTQLVRDARAAGLPIVLDATPLRSPSLPPELLAVDLLSANEVEAEQLLGRAIDAGDDHDLHNACTELRALGPAAVVLKLGAAGAAWADADGAGRVSAPAVAAVDPTGAGDAFMAGLVLRLLERRPLPEAVEFACLLGALSATGRGAQGGWSTPSDVRRFAELIA